MIVFTISKKQEMKKIEEKVEDNPVYFKMKKALEKKKEI